MATKTKKAVTSTKGTTATVTDKKVKGSKLSKAQIDEKNIKDTVKTKVTSEREVKYKYPEAIIEDVLKKKEFRQKTRNALKKFELDLMKIKNKDSKEYIKLNKEFKAYKKERLLVPGA